MECTSRNARYLAKVDVRGPAECWPWTAAKNQHGYGRFRGDGEQLAHRHGYAMRFGPIPAGHVICHTCDNPECQNPSHWFLGTPADNNDDKMRKGRHRAARQYGMSNGNSKFTESDVAEMRRLYAAGHTQATIAGKFHTSQQTVSKVLRAERWSHKQDTPMSRPFARARGEQHHNAKITYEIADEIRQRYADGGITQRELSNEYGIPQPSVSLIVRLKAWVK